MYKLEAYIINKNQQGYLPPDKFNLINNQGQRSYIAYLLGDFQTYMPGRPVAKVELGENSIVRQRLSPVIYGYILNIDVNGNSPYPGDYLQTDAMWSLYGYDRIAYVPQEKWYSSYNSVIDPVATNPIYLIKDTGFQFAPENTGQAKLSYVRNPPDIIWGYTTDGNGRPVYNPATSQDPIWDNLAIFEIICRSLRMVGVNLQSQVVSQFADEIKNSGQ
jgi:hypothetical protein